MTENGNGRIIRKMKAIETVDCVKAIEAFRQTHIHSGGCERSMQNENG